MTRWRSKPTWSSAAAIKNSTCWWAATLQHEYGQESQVIMTMPILEGLDGVQKMSKSLGNYVGISEPPAEMFGKLMSISDEMMWRYYLLLTDLSPQQIEALKQEAASGGRHPMDVKKSLASRVVRDFHGEEVAQSAQRSFEVQHQQGGIASEILTVHAPYPLHEPRKLFRLLADLQICASKSEAQRKIKEGAVYIAGGDLGRPDWQRISDPAWEIDPNQSRTAIIRIGRERHQVAFC